MDVLQHVRQNWQWISANPWGFAAFAMLFIGLGWAAAFLFLKERLEIQKARLDDARAKPGSAQATKAICYPPAGRHGRNVLSASTPDVTVAETVSVRAEIPADVKLHLVFKLPIRPEKGWIGAWSFSVPANVGWSAETYLIEQAVAEQHFDAESSVADLKLSFHEPGDLQIAAFENGEPSPKWSRIVRIRPAPGALT